MKALAALISIPLTVAVAAAPTDAPPATDPVSEAVAREILEIQEQLGGSIVTETLQEPSDLLGNPARQLSDREEKALKLLRNSAASLDRRANEFEWLELYVQADALRELADKLRQDGRNLLRQPSRPE